MAVLNEGVESASPAMRSGMQVGETLLSINGNEISDVLDYRFYMTDPVLEVETRTFSGQTKRYRVEKEEYEELGLTFDTYLMDRQMSCKNRCIFCFIDQMPKGMRPSLYFKDDDSRMSFLFGNYVTMTNMTEQDIQRIIKMHISPINVSVHTTDPQLRTEMMANPKAGSSLKYLRMLADGGIRINVQMVLCPGINDGEALRRSLEDLEKLMPALESVSCVPVGLTKYRDGLYPLRTYTKEEALDTIELIHGFAQRMLQQYGRRVAYPSDEFFLKAQLPFPPVEYYGDFDQLESGVGMMALLEQEFQQALEGVASRPIHRTLSAATGLLAYPLIKRLGGLLMERFPGLDIRVYAIENRYFGEEITVAGLITGEDLTAQLAGKPLGEALIIPAVMLRHEQDRFLDDMPLTKAQQLLGVEIRPVQNDGFLLADALAGEAVYQ